MATQSTTDAVTSSASPDGGPGRNLLTQEAVLMTVLAQDPSVVDASGPIRAAIPVPAGRLQRGPQGHRFRVLDIGDAATAPVVLHAGSPWAYVDRWTREAQPDARALVEDRGFRAQNVYAVAAHTLALFEQHLGRPIPWRSGLPQLDLFPQAEGRPNASYSRTRNAVLFGWLPTLRGRPGLYTALSYDVIAHEVSHAVLDGLRPRYTEPSLPDQLAFHEALADLVAMLSVFTVPGVALRLLRPREGRIHFPCDAEAAALADEGERRTALVDGRARELMQSPLTRLGEQVGAVRSEDGNGAGRQATELRWSVLLEVGTAWREYAEPHRRAEVLVAAFMQTLVTMWAGRLAPLRPDPEGVDAERVAEEGVKSARHLLGMLLRALDYLPPVDLTFPDVIDAVLTADRRVAPDDEHGYREALEQTFARFGIEPPPHRIVDADGVVALTEEHAARDRHDAPEAAVEPDPDAGSEDRLRYEHLNLAALRTSPEEVFQFIWNNAALLKVDVRYPTRVERVLSSTRVGPDGLVVTEVLADYTQTLRTTVGALPPGITAPEEMAPDAAVELWGGGVLVFDQFGRFRLHQRQPILDVQRQTERLRHLSRHGSRGHDGVLGAADPVGNEQRFALLHRRRG